MNMELISLLSIFVALAIIVYGTLKGLSLIIVASIATFFVALCSGVGMVAGYDTYLKGVGNSVVSMFPLFLGGQLLGCFLEESKVTESVANAIVRKFGTKAIILAVFLVSFVLVFCGVNVFVIIFTVYPLAVAFFKLGDYPRELIPACVLGACVAEQVLPGVTTTANALSTEAFNMPAATGPVTGIVCSLFLLAANGWYLHNQGKRALAKGKHFVPLPGEDIEVDVNKTGLPHPATILIPIGATLIFLNVLKVKAYASLFVGAVVAMIVYWKRVGGTQGVIKVLNKAAKGSQGVMNVCAIVGFATIVTSVPGYNLLLAGLQKISGGNPYIFAFVAVAAIAAVAGSATGGVKFVLDGFTEQLLAMGGNPANLVRVICCSSLTFDSLPHNGATVMTINACKVDRYMDGYKHVFVVTVINTVIATVIAILFAMIGIQ